MNGPSAAVRCSRSCASRLSTASQADNRLRVLHVPLRAGRATPARRMRHPLGFLRRLIPRAGVFWGTFGCINASGQECTTQCAGSPTRGWS
jgi:hypothetical protein